MRLLIVGGHGFPGARLAERFIRDRHSVSIIDVRKITNSSLSRSAYKHYNLKNADPECLKIFESNSFEVVIYIPDNETGNDFSGLKNILELSAKTNVKRIIFISSTSVYGDTKGKIASEESEVKIDNSSKLNYSLGEYYCIRFGKTKNINTLILRLSDVYGPRQDPASGVSAWSVLNISSIINNAIKNKKTVIPFPPGKTYDFIYVDDAVDAIYRFNANRNLNGIFNISSGQEISTGSLIKDITLLKGDVKIKYEPRAEKDSATHSAIDNSRAKKTVEWEPSVSLKEGLKNTFQWLSENIVKKRDKKKPVEKEAETVKKTVKSQGWKTVVAVLENILLFAIFAFLQNGEMLFDIKLPDIRIEYMIIYIILIGVIWGQVQAYLAMILASALFIITSMLSGADLITFFYIPSNLVQLALYLLVGIITGYTIERKNREIITRDANFLGLRNKYLFLLDIYNQTKLVKNELESQVINAEDSFSTIYNIIQEVDSLEIERVFSGAIGAIERVMKTSKVSIYVTGTNGNNDFIRLKARSLALAGKVPNSFKISDFVQIKEVIDKKRYYANRVLEAGIPILMAPVLNGEKVIAIIMVHETGFENITRRYENLFLTVTGLISNSLKRAYFFEKSLEDKRYLPDTKILTADTFEKVFAEVRNHREELDMSYALLKVLDGGKNYLQIYKSIASGIRENDYIGTDNKNNLFILLSNTSNNYAGLVIERLQSKGVNCEFVKEETFDE